MVRTSALFAPLVISSSIFDASAQTVDVCRSVRQMINHPAKYVSEKVQECRRNWLAIAINPLCCAPGWELNPSCYAVRQVKVKDAFSEEKEVVKCDPRELAGAAVEFTQWYTNPKLVALQPLKSVIDIFESVQSTLLTTQSRPLPDDVFQYLSTLVGTEGIPFTVDELSNARWVPYKNTVAWPYSPKAHDPEKDSITYGNTMILGPETLAAAGCTRFAKWGHEMVHVHQYHVKGYHAFLVDYLEESQVRKVVYEEMSAEREAYAVEARIEQICGNKPKGTGEQLSFTGLDGSRGTIIRNGSAWLEYKSTGTGLVKAFDFVETKRDATHIHLYDRTRNFSLRVPLAKGPSFWSNGGQWNRFVDMEYRAQ